MIPKGQKYVEEKHYCPHCNTRLSCCEAPPFHIGDGLGWGTDVMFICLNDECPPFVKGWQHIEDQYGHTGSYRYMLLPGEKKGEMLMVGSKIAFTGSLLDPEVIKEQDERYQKEKTALKQLETCIEDKNIKPLLVLILDENAKIEGRLKACKMLPELNDLSCIDAIRNHTFRNSDIEHSANLATKQLLQAHYKKECPFCAEIIKMKAKLCKHCNKEIT